MTPLIIASTLTLTLSLAIAYWLIFGKHYEPAEIEHYPDGGENMRIMRMENE